MSRGNFAATLYFTETIHMNKFLTLRQAAAQLQLSERTTWSLITGGDLPAFRAGRQWRILESKLLEWVEQRSAKNTSHLRKGGSLHKGQER